MSTMIGFRDTEDEYYRGKLQAYINSEEYEVPPTLGTVPRLIRWLIENCDQIVDDAFRKEQHAEIES